MITHSMGAARLESVSPMLSAQRPRPGNRVLVPVIRGQSAASLLALGDAIAEHCPARGVVLSLVEIPSRWSGMVTSAVARSRELLRWIAATDYEIRDRNRGERLSIHSRFTTDPAATIGEALLETGCDTIVVEFPPVNAARHHRLASILQAVSEDVQLNLVVARPDPTAKRKGIRPRSVLVPLRGGPNAWLALSVGMALSSWAEARLTLLHVYDRDRHQLQRQHERAVFHQLAHAAKVANPEIVEIESDATVEAVLGVATHFDAVVLGAHMHPSRTDMLVSQMLTSVIDHLTKTVILTRSASGLMPAA